ncbi:TetR/AcrR family transcriptional regulator [Lihuaxuella thermophila]|uniref:DNA-binding transcriptional regulator, AcrR family n=1 Tax=Lihuaxuella thermophila TaxID=1173111 RepID=A0A1H8C4V3_9BACL|nr:TetR/AcrR family transcriptional regulator [Lihuaxuella thermophila]SEM89484.1 DNA-binding transcriptional regulator, AcrR family [Lihuaxuella thermophila]
MDREWKRSRTKQTLLDATKELVREKGCSKMTLNDIMERTGFSKGAIYHYVKSKHELLAWVLQERIEEINDRFFSKVKQGKKELDGPLQEIINNLPSLQDPHDVTNRIFIYLLGQSDDPAVREVVQRFYQHSIQLAKQWIAAGQQAGVIPLSINADQTAELFTLISYGLRIRSNFTSSDSYAFTVDDFAALMTGILQSKNE